MTRNILKPIPCQSPSQGEALLVTSAISHQAQKTREIKIYKRDVKITRNAPPPGKEKVYKPRGKINSFSQKSRARLKFTAANSDKPLVSQFCLTYHENSPDNGRTVKRHLDAWLKYFRSRCPGESYLWVLEFQRRGAPHFHVWLTLPPEPSLQQDLAARWTKITGETELHQIFHSFPTNWIDWEMGSGAYPCKYLAKDEQKQTPEHFKDVGRFWGCSRRMVTVQDIVTESELGCLDRSNPPQVNPLTGEIETPKAYARITRALRRYQKATYRQFLKGKRLRIMCSRSNLIPKGAAIIPRLIAWQEQQSPPF